MATITEKQMTEYVTWGCTGATENPDYQAALKLEEEKKRCEKYTYCRFSNEEETRMCTLFTNVASSYAQQAKGEKNPLHRAYLFAKAKSIFSTHLGGDYRAREQKEALAVEEALACGEGIEWVSTPAEKASLAFRAASLLDLRPIEQMPHDFRKEPKQYINAAAYWEGLGDLFLKHGNEINLFFLNVLKRSVEGRPEYAAAICYEYAAYSMRNGILLASLKKEKRDLGGSHVRQIALLDKSIDAMECVAIKMKEVFFNAEFHEMLAGLYQSKLNSLYFVKKGDAEDPALKLQVYTFRMKSAELYSAIVEKGPDYTHYHYHRALNFREAACHVKTVGEAAELLTKAASSAAAFREYMHRPLTHPTGGENDQEAEAFHILISHAHKQKLLAEKGANHPLPKPAFV